MMELLNAVIEIISPENKWTKYSHSAVTVLNTFRNQGKHPNRDFFMEKGPLMVKDPFYDHMRANYCNVYHLAATLTLVAYSLIEIMATWAGKRGVYVPPEISCYNIRDCHSIPEDDKKGNKGHRSHERNPGPDTNDVRN